MTEPTRRNPEERATGAMHEDVPDWSDPCCSCEAEPYWREAAEAMGSDPDAPPGTVAQRGAAAEPGDTAPAEPPSPGAAIAGQHQDLPGEGGMPRREEMRPSDHRARKRSSD